MFNIFKPISLPLSFLLLFSSSMALAEECAPSRRIYKGKTIKEYAIKLNEAEEWEKCSEIMLKDTHGHFTSRAGSSFSALRCEKTGSILDKREKWIVNKNNKRPVALIPRGSRMSNTGTVLHGSATYIDECNKDADGITTTCKKGAIFYYSIDAVNIPIDILQLDVKKYECESNDDFY